MPQCGFPGGYSAGKNCPACHAAADVRPLTAPECKKRRRPAADAFALKISEDVFLRSNFLALNSAVPRPTSPLFLHFLRLSHPVPVFSFILSGYSGEHIDPLPLRFHWQHGRTAFQGKTALYDFTAAYARLIRPIDDGILCFCTS